MNMQQLINREGIKVTSELVDRNPNMPDWHDANHFKVVLRNKHRRRMTVYFSQGYAIDGEPDAASVLDCLASDAASIENAGRFEEWAFELGYDEDSRKAEATFRVVERQAQALERFMNGAYETLLWHTERL